MVYTLNAATLPVRAVVSISSSRSLRSPKFGAITLWMRIRDAPPCRVARRAVGFRADRRTAVGASLGDRNWGRRRASRPSCRWRGTGRGGRRHGCAFKLVRRHAVAAVARARAEPFRARSLATAAWRDVMGVHVDDELAGAHERMFARLDVRRRWDPVPAARPAGRRPVAAGAGGQVEHGEGRGDPAGGSGGTAAGRRPLGARPGQHDTHGPGQVRVAGGGGAGTNSPFETGPGSGEWRRTSRSLHGPPTIDSGTRRTVGPEPVPHHPRHGHVSAFLADGKSGDVVARVPLPRGCERVATGRSRGWSKSESAASCRSFDLGRHPGSKASLREQATWNAALTATKPGARTTRASPPRRRRPARYPS